MTDFSTPPEPSEMHQTELTGLDAATETPAADTAVTPAGRGRKVATAVAAVLGVGAAVALVAVLAGRSADSGGADNAKDAVNQLATAISNEDIVGALTVLAPDEVDGLPQLVKTFTDKAKEQGIQGVAANQGLDLTVTVNGLDEVVLAPHASAVTVDATVTADAEGVKGPVGAIVEGTHSADVSLRLVVVQIDGGWYVSPMLTGAEYIAKANDLPAGDYSKIDPAAVTTKAADAEAAAQEFVRAAATQNLDGLIDTLGPGESRVLRVFHEAAAELLADRDFNVTVDDVKATASGDGAVLNHLALTVAHDDGTTQHADYTDGCLTVDDQEPSCLNDNGMVTTLSLRPDELVWKVVDADGNHRVSLVGTFIGLAQRALDQFDGPKFLGALGLEVYGDAAPIEVDKPLKGTIDPAVGYAVFEFTATEGTSYYAEGGSDSCFAQVYREDGTGNWQADYTGATPGGRARVVVRCFDGESGDYEVTVKEGDGGFSAGPITEGDTGGGETMTADLSNGPVTVTLLGDYRVGDSVDVMVLPEDGQDIAISSPDCLECGTVNDGEGGAAEIYFFDVAEDGATHEVTITPVGPADAKGTVTIMVSSIGQA